MRKYTGKCVICDEENSLNFLFDRRFAKCTYCELPYYRAKESEPWQHGVPELPDPLKITQTCLSRGYGCRRFHEWLNHKGTQTFKYIDTANKEFNDRL